MRPRYLAHGLLARTSSLPLLSYSVPTVTGHVQAWLAYLIVNHPDYQTVTIDPTRLAQLPEDGSIIDDVPIVLDDNEDENNENKEDQGQPTESEQPSGGIWPKSTPFPPYSPHMPSIRACEEAPPVETCNRLRPE